jgi:hypothetical protein
MFCLADSTRGNLVRPQTLALLVVTGLLTGYYLWSLLVSSRYQALCNLNYWSATREQLDSCLERKDELDTRR